MNTSDRTRRTWIAALAMALAAAAFTGHAAAPGLLGREFSPNTTLVDEPFYALAALLPSARAVPVVGNLLAAPMLFLSSASAPLEVMPSAVQRAAQFNPLQHAVTLLRGAWFGEPWSALAASTTIVAGLLVVAAAFAAWRFRWGP